MRGPPLAMEFRRRDKELTACLVIAIATLLSTAKGQGGELHIIPSAESVTKAIGESLFFTCEPRGTPKPTDLQWESPINLPITNQGRVRVEWEDGNLLMMISPIEAQDTGLYKCKGRNAGSPIQSQIRLDVKKGITFDDAPERQTPKRGTDALIKCVVSGIPAPKVDWKRVTPVGQPLVLEGRFIQEQNGLRIRDIADEDSGIYTCRARVKDTGSVKQRNITVDVYSAPEWVKKPEETMTAAQNMDITIECRAEGKPNPTYKWYRIQQQWGGEHEIMMEDRYTVRQNGNLEIRKLQQNQDEAMFKCVASNDVGQLIAQIALDVQVPPKIVHLPNVTVVENSPSELECRANGDPTPAMRWKLPNSDFIDATAGKYVVLKDRPGESKLRIADTKSTDAGNYYCEATNNAGFALDQVILTVEFAPNFFDTPGELIYSWITSQLTNQNNKVNLTCRANGQPLPSIQWYKQLGIDNWQLISEASMPTKEFPLVEMHKKKQVESRLQVQPEKKSDFGYFKCTAVNKIAQAEYRQELREAVTPLAPRLDIPRSTATTLTLTIERGADGGLPITAYKVEYRKTQDVSRLSWQEHTVEKSDDNTYFLRNLRHSTMYTVRVAGMNAAGRGQFSGTAEMTTQGPGIPTSPINRSPTLSKEPGKMRLAWEVMDNGGAEIEQISVRYIQIVNGSSQGVAVGEEKTVGTWYKVSPDPAHFYVLLRRLLPDTPYRVQIRIKNRLGWSVPTTFNFRTKAGVVTADDLIGVPKARVGLSTAAIIGIVVAIFLILLVIIDVSCYVMNECGVLMCVCVNACGKQPSDKGKEIALEEGDKRSRKIQKNIESDDDVGPRTHLETAA